MSTFVPMGYLALSQATCIVGMALLEEDWKSSQVTPEELEAYNARKSVAARKAAHEKAERERVIALEKARRAATVRTGGHIQSTRSPPRTLPLPSEGEIANRRREISLAESLTAEQFSSIEARLAARRVCFATAWSRLRSLLLMGSVPAYARTETFGILPVHVGQWGGKKADTPPESVDLWPSNAKQSMPGYPLILESELRSVLDGRPARQPAPKANEAGQVKEAPKNRGGRPPKQSWEEIWLYINQLIYLGEYGEELKDFKAKVLEYAQNSIDDPPSPENIEKAVRRVWHRLKLDRRG